jgi:hypothetical protein
MQADRGDQVRMAQGDDLRQRRAGRQAGHVDAARIDGPALHHLLDRADHPAHFATALLRGTQVPVPTAVVVDGGQLLRIQHGKTLALGQRVHARALGEIIGGLGAAMQHHHQGHRLLLLGRRARGHEQPIVHAPRRRQAIGQLKVERAQPLALRRNGTGAERLLRGAAQLWEPRRSRVDLADPAGLAGLAGFTGLLRTAAREALGAWSKPIEVNTFFTAPTRLRLAGAGVPSRLCRRSLPWRCWTLLMRLKLFSHKLLRLLRILIN